MSIKRLVCLLLVCMLSVSIVACGKDGDGDGATTKGTTASNKEATTKPADTDRKIELVVIGPYQERGVASYFDYWFDRMDEWLEAHPNVTIDNQSVNDFNVMFERRKAAFAADDPPNIMYNLGYSDLEEFVEYGYVIDLEPYLRANNNEWYDMFYEWQWEGYMFEKYPGIYAVPFTGQVTGNFANMDHLKEVGFNEPPKTMEEWADMCEALLAKGERVPHLLSATAGDNLYSFFSGMVCKAIGGDFIGRVNRNEIKFTDPKMVEVMTLFLDYHKRGYFGGDKVWEVDVNAMRNAFYNMDTTFLRGNNFLVGVVMAQHVNKDQVAYFATPNLKDYPENDGIFSAGVGDAWMACDVGDPVANDLAVDFLKYITIIENFQINAEMQAYALQPVVKVNIPETGLDPLVQQFQDSLKSMTGAIRPALHDTWGAEARETMCKALQDLFYGDLTPEETCQIFQDAIDKALGR